MDDIIDPPVEEIIEPPAEVCIDVVVPVSAGGPSRVAHIKEALTIAAPYLADVGYEFASERVVDALTFIEAQQARQGQVT